MTTYFVDSAGSNTSPYDTWAKAATQLATVLAVPATNADTIYVAKTHSYTQATALTHTLPTSPGLKILTVTPSGESGNSGLATGAIEGCSTGNVGYQMNGFGYVYGMTLQGSSNANSSCTVGINNTSNPGGIYLENCSLVLRSVSSPVIPLGPSGNNTDDILNVLRNCTFKFAAAGSSILLRVGRHHLQNCSLDAAGSVPTTLFTGSNIAGGTALVEASDLSGRAFTNVANIAWSSTYDLTMRNCKFPSGPGERTTLTTGTPSGPGGLELKCHNCDSADTQYNFGTSNYMGTVVEETTIVRTGGGAQSHRMDSTANTKFPELPLTVEGSIYNSTTGSAKTLTVEYVHDVNVAAGQGAGSGNAFQDDQLWVEVIHLGTSGVPLGVLDLDDRKADVLATAADQTSSSVAWTTTGLTTPTKGKLTCTFTPQEVGYVHYKVCLAAASKTVYVDALGASIA